MRTNLRSGSTNSTGMARLVAAVLCVALAGLSTSVLAQDAVPLELNGQQGVWLPFQMAQRLQIDAEQVPLLREQLAQYETRAALTDTRIQNLHAAVDESKQAEQAAIDALLSAERLAREARESRDSWHRSPWLWTGVGGMTAVVVMLVATRMVNAARR